MEAELRATGLAVQEHHQGDGLRPRLGLRQAHGLDHQLARHLGDDARDVVRPGALARQHGDGRLQPRPRLLEVLGPHRLEHLSDQQGRRAALLHHEVVVGDHAAELPRLGDQHMVDVVAHHLEQRLGAGLAGIDVDDRRAHDGAHRLRQVAALGDRFFAQVPVGQDADRRSGAVGHDQRADAVLGHQPRGRLDGGAARRRHRIAAHEVADRGGEEDAMAVCQAAGASAALLVDLVDEIEKVRLQEALRDRRVRLERRQQAPLGDQQPDRVFLRAHVAARRLVADQRQQAEVLALAAVVDDQLAAVIGGEIQAHRPPLDHHQVLDGLAALLEDRRSAAVVVEGRLAAERLDRRRRQQVERVDAAEKLSGLLLEHRGARTGPPVERGRPARVAHRPCRAHWKYRPTGESRRGAAPTRGRHRRPS